MLWPAIIVFGGLGLLLRKKKPHTPALPPGKTIEEINAELWAQPGADFVVEIYGVDKFRAPPPPSSDSVTASANCDTIVVGKDWWDVAGAHAEKIIDGGTRSPAAIADRIMLDMMPTCASSGAQAVADLRAEIIDRLQGYIPKVPTPERNPIKYGVGVGTSGFGYTGSGNQQASIFDGLKKIKLPTKCGSLVCPPGWTCVVGSDSNACVQPSPDGSSLAVRTTRGARVIPTRGGNIATLISGRRGRR